MLSGSGRARTRYLNTSLLILHLPIEKSCLKRSSLMETLLTPAKTNTLATTRPEDLLVPTGSNSKSDYDTKLEVLDDAVTVLTSEPSLETLRNTLSWLESHFVKDDVSNIKVPGSRPAQVVFVLINAILPTYWTVLNDARDPNHVKVRTTLIKCLGTVTGISVTVNQLNVLLKDRQTPTRPEHNGQVGKLAVLTNFLQRMLKRTSFIHDLWHDLVTFVSAPSKRSLLWKEAVSLLATGKVLSLVAQADLLIKDSMSVVHEGGWLGDGPKYATWLGSNIDYMMGHVDVANMESRKAISQMLSKALVLGYTGEIVQI